MAKKIYRYIYETKEFRLKAIQALQEKYPRGINVGTTDESHKFYVWIKTTGNDELDFAVAKFMSEQYGFIKD